MPTSSTAPAGFSEFCMFGFMKEGIKVLRRSLPYKHKVFGANHIEKGSERYLIGGAISI